MTKKKRKLEDYLTPAEERAKKETVRVVLNMKDIEIIQNIEKVLARAAEHGCCRVSLNGYDPDFLSSAVRTALESKGYIVLDDDECHAIIIIGISPYVSCVFSAYDNEIPCHSYNLRSKKK